MELRVLQYFLAVAREQSISGAAEFLHLSQPTLSRQIKDMEKELGKQLLIRGNRRITLTEEGMILCKRAEEIMELVKKTESEITLSDESIAGDIYIGAGESNSVGYIAKVANALRREYPFVHFHIESGDAQTVYEQLDKGLIDFGLLFGNINLTKYNSISLPTKDTWGVLMPKDSELAQKDVITPNDLMKEPLIVSRQGITRGELQNWFKLPEEKLNVVATYNLLYNASLLVEEGVGYALCLDKIINTSNCNLCFKPLYPKLEVSMSIVWKKHQVFSKASNKFLDLIFQ
ncbi:MAG TPA: LysR family transcriptional regulator [Candidatus Eubacterium faecigallinarum]|nr:LysR family transcriptional regulator [Candidatus Eubacterium faecigallinarum]